MKRWRKPGLVPLVAAALLAMSACTSATVTGSTPAHSTSVVVSAPTTVPAPTTAPLLPPVTTPTPAPTPSAASVRAAFGSGCDAVSEKMPATKYQARIGDVDGDGRADIEWATLPRSGFVEFGVTTASGTTVARTVGFASGGPRSVSIATLSTGQTVALPTDQHGAPLYVIHDCRWIEPEFASHVQGFLTDYNGPSNDGGGCIGRRLYQVESTQPSGNQLVVTGITERISANGRTVTAGRRITLLLNEDTSASQSPLARYGDGNCLPSPRLTPVARSS